MTKKIILKFKKCLDCNEAMSLSTRQHLCEIELKRQQYREFHTQNPLPLEHGTEFKECEGCYCQLSADSEFNFCSGCRGCDGMGCPWGCCDCYSDGTRGWKGRNGKIAQGSHRGQEKKLIFTQKQRLHLEQIIQQTQDLLAEIKEQEDPDGWWKRMEDIHRWQRQEKARILSELTKEELAVELSKREQKS